MFIAVLFTVKAWKKTKWTLMDEWVNNTWYACTMEYPEKGRNF